MTLRQTVLLVVPSFITCTALALVWPAGPACAQGRRDLRAITDDLHAELTRLGVRDAALDVGLVRHVWPQELAPSGLVVGPPVMTPGAPDGRIDLAEIFQAALVRLQDGRFATRSFAEESPEEIRGLLAAVRGSQLLPPWLVDDGDRATHADRRAREAIDRVATAVRNDAWLAGLAPGTRAFHDHVIDALLLATAWRRIEGGLGIRYSFDDDNSHHRRNVTEAYADGVGDCNAHAFLFYALARRAGLDPTFIHITGSRAYEDEPFTAILHVGAAVRLDAELVPVDPSRRRRLEPGLALWYELTDRQMLANHVRNLGLHDTRDLRDQEGALLDALALSPWAFDIAHDTAWLYEHRFFARGTAAPYLRRAVEINPSMRGIWETGP